MLGMVSATVQFPNAILESLQPEASYKDILRIQTYIITRYPAFEKDTWRAGRCGFSVSWHALNIVSAEYWAIKSHRARRCFSCRVKRLPQIRLYSATLSHHSREWFPGFPVFQSFTSITIRYQFPRTIRSTEHWVRSSWCWHRYFYEYNQKCKGENTYKSRRRAPSREPFGAYW